MANEAIGETYVTIRPDTKEFKDDLRRNVDRAVNDVERGTGRLKGATAGLTDLRGAATGAGGALDVLDMALAGTSSKLLLGGAAAGAAVVGVAKAVDAYTDLTDSVRQFAQRSGASAEEASRFVAVTDDYGISATTAANSLFFLGRAAETNAKGLTGLGVTIERTSTGQLDLAATVQSVADAYQRTNDPGKRAALVMTALGRQGRELIPILQKGGQGLRELFADVPGGQLMSERDLQRAMDFKLSMDDAHDAVMELQIALAEGVVPALATAARASAPLIRAVGFVTENLVTGLSGIINAVRNPTELADWDKFTAKVLGSNEALTDLVSTELDAADSAEAMLKAHLGEVEATMAHEAALDKLGDARQSVIEAEQDYQDALRGTGKYADAAAAAAARLENAQEGLVRAQRRVRETTLDIGEATEDLAGAQIRYGIGSKEARAAARELERRQADLSEAQGEVADSVDEIREAQEELARTRDLTDARRIAAEKLDDAQRNLKEALFATAEQEVALRTQTELTKGVTVETKDQIDFLRTAIEKLRDTEIPAGSPLRTSLSQLLAQLRDPSVELRPGEPGYIPPLQPGEAGPPAPGQGRAAGPPIPSSPAIGQVVINYPIDFEQLLEQAEYASGVRG